MSKNEKAIFFFTPGIEFFWFIPDIYIYKKWTSSVEKVYLDAFWMFNKIRNELHLNWYRSVSEELILHHVLFKAPFFFLNLWKLFCTCKFGIRDFLDITTEEYSIIFNSTLFLCVYFWDFFHIAHLRIFHFTVEVGVCEPGRARCKLTTSHFLPFLH